MCLYVIYFAMIENPKNFEENNQIKPATAEESGRVESGKTEAWTHKGRKFFTMLAIATTLAATSCDSIPSREEMAANRIARKEMRAAQRATISANEMVYVKSQLNSYIKTYEDLVDKHNELVDRLQCEWRNSALENNIGQLNRQIRECEKKISKLSKEYFDLNYIVSANTSWTMGQVYKYDKWKYNYLRDLINK